MLRNIGVPDGHTITIYESTGGYRALAKALRDYRPEQIIELVKESRLRGRGGAGFPTGLKWSFVPKQSEKPKYLCVNADEGEPGTFKDRIIMERDPHQLIEGMAITAYAIGAHVAYVYIRGEYVLAIRTLEAAIEEARAKGYLGRNILGSGFDFDMHIHCGAGAYICGEETAMLDSLEGKRAQPRLKPPFPAVAGLYASPTVINNVETLACVPHIVLRGPAWFAGIGPEKSPGPKLYCLSGHVRKPGLYELPMGIPLRELIEEHAGGPPPGRRIKAVIPGGVSAPLIPESGLDVGMDFDSLAAAGSMLGSAGVIVIDDFDLRGQGRHPHHRVLPPRVPAASAPPAARGSTGWSRSCAGSRPATARRATSTSSRRSATASSATPSARSATARRWGCAPRSSTSATSSPPISTSGGARSTERTRGSPWLPSRSMDTRCEAEPGTTILTVAERLGIDIPTFCYQKRLPVLASCRMCLVEIEGQGKLHPSCAMPVTDGMVVHTNSPRVVDTRAFMLDMLLANHPLDCPICDKGGECELQDMVMAYGPRVSRFREPKRVFHSKDIQLSPVIIMNVNRCIQCQRCVRMCEEVVGAVALGTVDKGMDTAITGFEGSLNSCDQCGNCVEVCPVGALMSFPYRYKSRPWDLVETDTICPHCGTGCQLTVGARDGEFMRVRSKWEHGVNLETLCARGRFGLDFVAEQGPHQAADDPPRRRPRPGVVGRGRRLPARASVGSPRRPRQGRRRPRVAPPDQRGALPVPEADADRLPHQQHRLVLALVGALRCAWPADRQLLRARAARRRAPRRLHPRRRQQRERGKPGHRIPAARRGAEPPHRALHALDPPVAARRRRPRRDPCPARREAAILAAVLARLLEAPIAGPAAGGVPQFRRGAGVAPRRSRHPTARRSPG